MTFFLLAAVALVQALSVFAQDSTLPLDDSYLDDSHPGLEESQNADSAGSGLGYETPYALQQILASNESRWRYPTDFTRGIVPKILHSHNDYWRDAPYYSALSVGAISVEADIWLMNDTLYVGHEESALTAERTIESLYINPILHTLRRQNPQTPFVDGPTKNGVFDTSSTQTLYLWLDCKTPGNATFTAAISALSPLRDAGYLTTYTPTSGVTTGPVTIIGTGNTPLSLFTDPSKERDYFFDAQLTQLGDGEEQSSITSNVTLIASTSFGAAIGDVGMASSGSDTLLTPTQLSTLQSQTRTAREKGIGARYWDTPGWPVRVRNRLWRVLYENGVSLINVDDLVAAAEGKW